jgi:hypothetical protein
MPAPVHNVVGVLGSSALATVDERGTVTVDDLELAWTVGAEDRWHDPRTDAAVRQVRVGPAPVYETRVRVPSGDAVQRVYGARARDSRAYVVVDVENASPAAFAIAFVVRAQGRGTLLLSDGVVWVDDRPRLVLPRRPMRWATATGTSGPSATEIVIAGDASDGAFEPVSGKRPEAAFVYPMAHRTMFRVAVPLEAGASVTATAIDTLPAVDDVQRGWATQLDRGMRAEVPGPLGERIDGARATALLLGGAREVSATTIANLEDWGFDAEAANAWERASMRVRRRARERASAADLHDRIATAPDDAVLRYARDALVVDAKSEVLLLPGFHPSWVGQSLTVHDAPTRAGAVSFALRWHGERPALLWDGPAGVTLRAPVLDPDWSAPGGAGETLLRPWAGVVDEGESFT